MEFYLHSTGKFGLQMLAYMTEVTRSSAMVREPTTIHSGDDSASSIDPRESGRMPDLSDSKLRKSQRSNRSPISTTAPTNSSGDEEGPHMDSELLEDKLAHTDSEAGMEEVSHNFSHFFRPNVCTSVVIS